MLLSEVATMAIDPEDLVTHRFKLDQAGLADQTRATRECDRISVVFE